MKRILLLAIAILYSIVTHAQINRLYSFDYRVSTYMAEDAYSCDPRTPSFEVLAMVEKSDGTLYSKKTRVPINSDVEEKLFFSSQPTWFSFSDNFSTGGGGAIPTSGSVPFTYSSCGQYVSSVIWETALTILDFSVIYQGKNLVCGLESVTLKASIAPETSYNWYVRSGAGNWILFRPNAGQEIIFNQSQLPEGLDLSKTIYFKATTTYGGFAVETSLISLNFAPEVPKPEKINPTDPLCPESGGSLEFINFKYSDNTSYYGGNSSLQIVMRKDQANVIERTVDANSFTINSISAGEWTVNIVNITNECMESLGTFTIKAAPAKISLPATPTIIHSTCIGQPATVTATATGGSGGYIYTLKQINGVTVGTSNSTGSFTISTSGTYYIEATDKYNCTPAQTSNFEIKIPTAIAFTTLVEQPSGYGKSDGKIFVNVQNAIQGASYEYQLVGISGWKSENTFEGLAEGTYRAQVRTGPNCVSAPKEVFLIAPDELSVSITKVTHVTCNEGQDGSIEVSAVGGTSGYEYSLDDKFINKKIKGEFTGLAAGKHTVYVKDSKGNIATAIATINPGVIINISASKTDVTCNDQTNGTIKVTASGGVEDYTYSLDGVSFQSGNTFTNRGAGNYTVTVKDKNGCTASVPVTINKPAPVSIEVATTKDAACQGSATGSVTLAASGGTGTGYQFSVNAVGFQASPSFSGLLAGDYTATVRDSNGCTASTPFKIGEPKEGMLLTEDTSLRKNISCFNGRDGSIVVSSSGGTGAMRYLINSSPVANSTGEFTGLAAGKHIITVIDDNECSKSIEVTLTQPSTIAFISTMQHVSCFAGSDGRITITATGGTGAYSYSIDNGVTFQSSNSFNGRSAGTYSIVVRDINNCRQSGTATVNQPLNLAGEISSSSNISCYGGSNGQLQVKATGGTSPYSYSLNGGAAVNTTGLFEGLSAGNYLIAVKDAKGCERMLNHTLTQPTQPLGAAFSQVPPTSYGASNGEITVTASGGTSPYTYAINGGAYQSGNKFTNLSAGSYTITVKDAKQCIWEKTVQLQEPSALTLAITLQQGISCHGASDGVIKIIVDGGVGPYLYSLNGGQAVSDPLFMNLAAGGYSISVTDSKGATKTSGYTLTQPNAITATYVLAPVSCYNGSDGKIEVRATGGTGILRYSRNGIDFQSSNIFDGLKQGSYSIYIQDEKGCTVSSVPQVITQPQLLTLRWQSTSDVSCMGGSDGSITVEAQGGNGDYSYSINNGPKQTSSTFSGLQAGTHQIIVTDKKGCQSASLEVEVAGPANPLAVQDIIKTDALCKGGNTGSIQVTASGGTAPYTFNLNGGSFNSTGFFGQLTAGTYTLTLKDSKGCTVTSSIAVQEPVELSIATSKQNINCYGEASGSITITATGGVAPYRYSLNGSAFQAGNSYSGLVANTYTVKVRDANGCEISSTETLINKYAPLTLTLDANPPQTCNDKGSIEVASVAGGLAPYTYSLDGVNFSSNKFFAELSAGDYTVFVKDASGCIGTATISPYGPVAIRATLMPTHITCFGGRDGSIQVQNATGGNGSHQYSIDGLNFQSSPAFTGLAKGTYTILVRDQPYSCQSSFTVTLTEPTQITVTADLVQDVSCFNGQDGVIRVLATGGTAPYAYAINGKPKSSANQFENLLAGDHDIVVTDSKGCVATGIITINQPEPLAIAGDQVQGVSCSGSKDGSIRLQVSGGTQPYKYLISGRPEQTSALFSDLQAGTYTIKVTDAKGCQLDYSVTVAEPEVLTTTVVPTMIKCQGGTDGAINLIAQGGASPYRYSITNGASFSNNSSFAGLAAGTYKIVVADQNNCTWTDEVALSEPAGIVWTSSKKEISCFGGSDGEIVVEATGGTGVLAYSLDNGAWISKGTFGNLSAGNYIIRIKDNSECIKEFSVSLTQPDKLNVALLSKRDVSCNGGSNGSIVAGISGGTQPYSITLNGQLVTGARFEQLSKGSYTLAVTDGKGCVDQLAVIIEEPAALSLELASNQDISCFGEANGVISVAAGGGTAPYVYSLNNSGFASASVFSSLAPGSYQVSVKDANGCVQTIQATLSQPNAPLSLKVVSKKDVSCKDGTDGILELLAEGGSLGYRYYINGNEISSARVSGLAAGTYRIEVKDAKGCIAQSIAIIGQPSVMVVNANLKNPVCFNDCSGEIALTTQGGTAPYTYTWLGNPNFGNNATISNLCSGVYQVLITDAQGCSIQQQFELFKPEEILITGIEDTVLCKGQQMTFYAGNSGAQYLWSADNGFSSIQSSVTISQAGNYQVRVTNELGCSASKSFKVTVSTSLLKADFLMASVANAGDTLFVVDVSKPTPSNTEWLVPQGATIVGSNASGTIKQIVFEAPGTYSTQLTVSLGECADVVQKTITILPKGHSAEAKDALGYQEELIKKFMLYPNPTTGYFSVLTELSQKQDITLQLINYNQNKVIELKEEKGGDKYTSVFNHPDLAAGVYILSLKVGKEVRTLKVVKI